MCQYMGLIRSGFEPNTTIEDGYKVYESILEEFYDEMTPITISKPYMVGPGNHEANCDNGAATDSTNNITYTASICMPVSSFQFSFQFSRSLWLCPRRPM